MANAACKAEWCDNQAQGQLNAGYETIEGFKLEEPEFRIKASEIYLKAMAQANAEIKKLVEE